MSPPTYRLRELKDELTRDIPPVARVIQSASSGSQSSQSAPASGVTVRAEANLFDFVQFECMRGLTRAVLVRCGEEEGVLYFDEGQIVHAETAGQEGQTAAINILCWQAARIEPCANVWVNPSSITTSWQGLLMMAAQKLDESAAGAEHASNAAESNSRVQHTPAEKVFSSLEEFVEFREPSLTRAVRLDSEGEVIASHGNLQDFPDAASYAVRLAELIGEGLGLENFSGLECVTSKRIMLAYVDEDSLVAVEGEHSTDLSQHRKRAGT